MYLKQIELENFKSFGKKLTIPLLEGYTVVTGPNGSGKSNISDAILFVLGPKSSRAIRAGRLTDLIFNGGKSKNPASFTRVSLVFDNEDRMVPLESDTVKLTRLIRLSQEGDGYNSYFYVNGRKSTLGEFDTLLSNSRISADGYNFVQQGDITKIVEMSDLERRKILDDISGISKFDEDIAKAETEREEAERNIERISIILNELERQIEQLKEEKEAATRYLKLKEQLTLSHAQMAHKRKESIESEIQSIRDQVAEQEKEMERLRARRLEVVERGKTVENEIAAVEREIEERGGEELRELKEKIDGVKIELTRSQDNAERALGDISEIEEALSDRSKERAEVEAKLTSLRLGLEKVGSEYEEESSLLSERRRDVEQLDAEIRSCDEALEGLNARIIELDSLLKSGGEQAHALQLERERLEDRKERLEREIAYLEEKVKSIEFEISDLDFNLGEIKGQARDSSRRLKEVQEDYYSSRHLEEQLSHQAEELEQAIRRLTREYNHLKAEQEAAENVARGYTRSVRALLEARDRGRIKGIHGTIAELARVEKRYEVALNVAAGGRMQSIVVDDDEVASAAIQFLKDNRLGRATFLPLNRMRAGRPRGKALMAAREAIGYAIDLVDFDEMYKGAFWYVFGDTIVVDTLSKARRLMGGVRLVTLDGELIEASGAMIGGTIEPSNLKFGGSKGKLEETGRQLKVAIEQSEDVSRRLREVRSKMLELERELRELSQATSEEHLKSLKAKREELVLQLAETKGDLQTKRKEAQELDGTMANLAGRLKDAISGLDDMRKEREELEARVIETAPTALSRRLKALQEEVRSLSESVYELKKERESLETQISLTEERLREMKQLETEAMTKIERLRISVRDSREREQKLRTELNALRKIEDSLSREMRDLRERRDSLFREKTSLEAEKDKIDTRIETSSDFTIGMRTKLSLAEDKLKEVAEEIESYAVEVTYPLPPMERLKEAIRSCETALSSMGPVNLKAIDDFEEKKGRHTALKEETGKLRSQRDELLALMRELNERKKVQFFKVFEAVNDNFKRTYAELSGGGEAELLLADPEEPFQGGLIIRARPKDGRALRLQALSGGEKSLTALSLIFAIQEFQPSPFYLLDEVDMFLDAMNADMVARRIQKASRSAQFVQITLRKVTMNKADHMIGVTMQEDGVSKVIMRTDLGDGLRQMRPPEGTVEGMS